MGPILLDWEPRLGELNPLPIGLSRLAGFVGPLAYDERSGSGALADLEGDVASVATD